jgi:hypothetical protein
MGKKPLHERIGTKGKTRKEIRERRRKQNEESAHRQFLKTPAARAELAKLIARSEKDRKWGFDQ